MSDARKMVMAALMSLPGFEMVGSDEWRINQRTKAWGRRLDDDRNTPAAKKAREKAEAKRERKRARRLRERGSDE